METPEQFLDELKHLTATVPIECGTLLQATLLMCKQAVSNQALQKELLDKNKEIELVEGNLLLTQNLLFEREERIARLEKRIDEKETQINNLLKRTLSISIEHVK